MYLKKGKLGLMIWIGAPYRVNSEHTQLEYIDGKARFTFDISKKSNFNVNQDGNDIVENSESWDSLEFNDNPKVLKNIQKFIRFHKNDEIEKIEAVFLFPNQTIVKNITDKKEDKEKFGYRFDFSHN